MENSRSNNVYCHPGENHEDHLRDTYSRDSACESRPYRPEPAAEPAETDPLAVPFADLPPRFWEKTAAFWLVNLLGLIGTYMLAEAGLTRPGPLLAAGVACGLTAGMAVGQARAGQGQHHRSVRCMVAATLTATVLLLFVEVGRQMFFMPTAFEAVVIAVVCYVSVWCVVSFLASVYAGSQTVAGVPPWITIGRRLCANWHRAIGMAALISSCMAASVPLAVAIAIAPATMGPKLSGLAARPSWLWMAPMGKVTQMVTRITGRIHPVAKDAYGALIMRIARRLEVFTVTLGLIVLGTGYAMLVTAAHVLTRLGSMQIRRVEPECG
ncbi:MAG TPA: hypothetical protein VM141_12250 [Planctomycetota bacterium]|nr:hypothetical protein [Planctomycetota bacterium]